MNLPQERQILHGRTHSESYNPAGYNAAYGPYRSPRHSTDWIIAAILIGIIITLSTGAI